MTLMNLYIYIRASVSPSYTWSALREVPYYREDIQQPILAVKLIMIPYQVF